MYLVLESLHNLIREAKVITTISHVRPDGDAVGSSLGVYGYLESIGKDVKSVFPTSIPDNLLFVPKKENILMLEGVIRAVARHKRRNPDIVFPKVKKRVINMFTKELKQQALMHVRHRVKRDVERRIDMKFTSINALENHMVELVSEINPRGLYDQLCREFHVYEDHDDYASILKVYNQKLMLNESNVATLCGFKSKDDYIRGVLNILKGNSENAAAIRKAIKECFGLEE